MRLAALLFGIALITLLGLSPSATSQGTKRTTPRWSDQKDKFGDPLPFGAVARIGTTRYRAVGNPSTAVMSPDAKLMAVDDDSGDITIWELPAWTKRRVIRTRILNKNNPPRLQDLEFSADGRQLIGLDTNQYLVYFLDVATGKTIKTLAVGKTKLESPATHLTLSRDQKTLVVTTSPQDNKHGLHVQVWDLAANRLTKSFEIPFTPHESVNYYTTYPFAEGHWLALKRFKDGPEGTGARDYYLEIWDLTTGKRARKIDCESSTHFVFSPEGKWLAATNGKAVLRIYDAATGAEKHNIRLRRTDQNLFLQFAPNGKSLWTVDEAGKVCQWDHVAGELMATYKGPAAPGFVGQLAFTPTGKILALGEQSEVAFTLWEVTTGKVFSPVKLPTSTIKDLTFTENGELCFDCGEGTLSRWNPRTAARLPNLRLEFLGDDRWSQGTGRFIQRRRANSVFEAGGHTRLSNGGQVVIEEYTGLSFFDSKTGKLLYDDEISYAEQICLFDGDSRAASIDNKKLRIWNARTGRDLHRFDLPLNYKERGTRLTGSPSGKHFVINTGAEASRSRTILWDAAQKKIVRDWSGPDRANAIAFSPDHRWLALAAAEKRLHLIRVGSPKTDFKLRPSGLREDIALLAFSPDGRQLACAAGIPIQDHGSAGVAFPEPLDAKNDRDSRRIIIYEVASKKIRLELAGHADGLIASLGYARDSGLLASGATDTTVLVWRAGLPAFAELAAGKDATPEELAGRFKAMSDADARAAFQSMIQLVQTPAQTVKLLDAKIVPAKPRDTGGKKAADWIHDLGSANFAARAKATAMLQKIGPSVESDLRAALPKAPDVETKRRIEELLEQIAAREWTQDEITHTRAVEVVDAIATPEARALLTRWREGEPGAVLTQEARQALARLAATLQ